MATPKPGEIRCPTCHRSTPPGMYCTQCGSPIPSDLRVRPRGLDRDELQDRIRQRRGLADPFRRGVGAGGYETFRPEPTDEAARRGEPAREEHRVDRYRDAPPGGPPTPSRAWPPSREGAADAARWARRGELGTPTDAAEPAAPRWAAPDAAPTIAPSQSGPPAPAPPPAEPAAAGYPADEPYGAGPYRADAPSAAAYDAGPYTEPYERPYPYEAAYPYEEERRGGGAGPLVIVGFLVLGVLALLGGAALAGVFSGDEGVADATPTLPGVVAGSPSAAPVAASPETAPAATSPGETPAASPAPDEPVVFEDGFRAEIRPCATPEMDFGGCVTDGSTLAGDSVFMWIGFQQASPDEVLQVLISSGGSVVFASEESPLGQYVSCAAPCEGYVQQSFSGLTPGEYQVELRRNGETADRASMLVEG